MKSEYLVDLHVHSRYSRATSKEMTFESLYRWGKIKGINVIGTGDFTHPAWFLEMQEKLAPQSNGLYVFKPELAKHEDVSLPETVKNSPLYFIPSVEISNIYTRHEKSRRLHNLIIMPDFSAIAEFNNRLSQIGNLKSDGRPILGLDSRNLLEICLEVNSNSLFIPAHIWTPWFSMFGSKSGFDTITQAFGDLAGEIKVVETGLSSDPKMNWQLSQLQNITLVSNSDAHSPLKLGREANILQGVIGFDVLLKALKTGDENFKGTVEFFPEEGKYHADGHKSCGVRTTPAETNKLKGLCPRCGKPLIIGVEHRINELADLPPGRTPAKPKQVEYLIPLTEIIAETLGLTGVTKKVNTVYERMINLLGNEFQILRKVSVNEIAAAGYPLIAKALENMRQGKVLLDPGYDGVFGTVKTFTCKDEMLKTISRQMDLL